MSKVVNLRAYANPAMPTLVLVDLQREYVAEPRMLALTHAAQALENCALALQYARRLGIPVAFTRWIGHTPFFNPASPFSRWIEGFEPTGADMIFDHSKPSCYGNPEFADVMSQGGGHFVIAGFAGEVACLSTAIDAFHRDHKFTFLADASASHALDDLPAPRAHSVVTSLIGLYGSVSTTKDWISRSSRVGFAVLGGR